jgi:hypothetical protein
VGDARVTKIPLTCLDKKVSLCPVGSGLDSSSSHGEPLGDAASHLIEQGSLLTMVGSSQSQSCPAKRYHTLQSSRAQNWDCQKTTASCRSAGYSPQSRGPADEHMFSKHTEETRASSCHHTYLVILPQNHVSGRNQISHNSFYRVGISLNTVSRSQKSVFQEVWTFSVSILSVIPRRNATISL